MEVKAETWKMAEFVFIADLRWDNPFWDVALEAEFVHDELGIRQKVLGFYDGADEAGRSVWKVRWTPVREGLWRCRTTSTPFDAGLAREFDVAAGPASPGSRGFLHTDPHTPYGFRYDNGEPFFLLGDTMYNLFGAHYCGVDTESIIRRRQTQGVNLIRARMHVSPYHPDVPNQWQTKSCWPWGGNAAFPDFTRLHLPYFRAVDEVVAFCSRQGIGLELILEGWMFEFPFNDRSAFTAEYELFWIDYITARYAAYDSVYLWCPANEYEFYPKGTPGTYNKDANRWLKRISDHLRSRDPYAHPIGAHNWEKRIPLPERLADADSIDVYLVQTDWGEETENGTKPASMCVGLERDLRRHAGKAGVVVVCAEFGYERVDGLFTAPWHQCMDAHHTRRGQWRAGFSGFAAVHGFDNTWAAHMRIDRDAEGAASLAVYRRFMTEIVRFDRMHPAPDMLLAATGTEEEGTLPLCLRGVEGNAAAVYFPAPGRCELAGIVQGDSTFRWYNPRTGEISAPQPCRTAVFATPDSREGTPGGDDWTLLVEGLLCVSDR